MRIRHLARLSLALLSLSIDLAAQAPVVSTQEKPAKIREELWLVPHGWAARIPPRGSVNAPGQVQVLSPGQGIDVALVADGTNRDQLFAGLRLTLRIVSSSGVVETQELKPVAIRTIKASGADMIMMVLDAADVMKQNKAAIEKATLMTSLAVFDTDWKAPASITSEQIRITAAISGDGAPLLALKPASLTLRPWTDWQKDPEPNQAALSNEMNGFHESPQPGRLLPMLGAAARTSSLKNAAVYAFFVAAFRENVAARQEAVKALPSLEPLSRWALLMVLRMIGEDISSMTGDLPEEAKESLRRLQPLTDPRIFAPFADPIDPQRVAAIGVQMDQCWGSWLATGDPSYVRSLAGLLNGAADFETFQNWIKAKGGVKGLNARVARGLAYQTAGWSLASFQRTDPQVLDWLLFWENDTALPQVLREQIRSIPSNPAFKKPG